MEKKLIKKILAILMIIMIVSTDFFVLGSNLITYALTLDSTTNNENIGFSAYFKNDKGEKVDTLQTSIKIENLKLYAEVTVKNDGYFNGTLELENSNFNIKNNILSKSIASIEGNKVTLKQINAGATAKIELDIEPALGDTMPADMLLKASELKLTGTYMETSYKGLSIESAKAVSLDLQADETAGADLETDIITNKKFAINGKDKRVVQVLVKSRLTDNQYPIKQTIIDVSVPVLSEKAPEVSVLSLGTLATNGKTTLTANDWKYEEESNNVKITLTNTDSEIAWNKDVYDELVVTFIYDGTVDASTLEIVTNSEITVHNSGTIYNAKYTKGIQNKEPNGIITIESEINTDEIYKGQLYANINAIENEEIEAKDIEYNTTTTLVVTNADIAEKIVITEGPDVFGAETDDLEANTKYISTQINKEKMLAILGTSGSITIKNGTPSVINGNTQADENGNIVISYEDGVSSLEITTSEPQYAGMLEITHTKAITENTYTRKQLQTVKAIKTKNTVEGIITVEDKEQNVVKNSAEASLELKETVSKVELTVNKENLSTTATNENVTLGVELITDGEQYDLFKNPKITIQLPSSVESVTQNGKPTLLNADDFEVGAIYNEKTKCIEITLDGEQLEYPERSATQLYLQLNLNITLSKLAPSKTDKIVMTYTNENATQYDGETTDAGIVEKAIGISAPSGLVKMFNLSSNENTSLDEDILQQVTVDDAGKELNFDIALINNTGLDMTNVKILGELPTDGNTITGQDSSNTLQTTLKSITASNATVYYTQNTGATADTELEANGWTTNLSELANAKLYLIKLDTFNKETNYTASVKVQLPSPITKDAMAYTEYKVIYDTAEETNIEEASRKIGFITPTEVKMETTISAEVGNDKLNNGDTVKAGEVIKYTMSVTNTGAQEIKNVQLKADVPEGTVVVEFEVDKNQMAQYVEKTEITEITETIPVLASGETYTKEYEVRVKQNITSGAEIKNKTVATCDNTTIESQEITNKLESANIMVTMKKANRNDYSVVSGGKTEYIVYIENLSNETINNLEVQILTKNLQIYAINGEDNIANTNDTLDKIMITEIPANTKTYIRVSIKTTEGESEASIVATVKDENAIIYRSNKNIIDLQQVDAKITLTSPQDKGYLKEGDTIEYIITVRNTGNINSNIWIKDTISEYLEVKAMYEDGVIRYQTTDVSNSETYTERLPTQIYYKLNCDPGQEKVLKVVAKIKEISEDFEIKVITNKAEAEMYGMIKDTSNEVTHTIERNAEDVKNVISGTAWLDSNLNGAKDGDETLLSGIKVRIYDTSTNDYLKDSNGNIVETTTNDSGNYTFTKIKNGTYIILFEYDTENYETTQYQNSNVDTTRTSKAVEKKITIAGEEKTYGVTDKFNLTDNIFNINLGLRERKIYDIELNKYISKIVVQNGKGTKTYDYKDATFAKVEINAKQLKGTVVVLEYTIKVKNAGEIAGYANSIVDYLPNELTFSSELNPDWYLSGSYLYTKKLESEVINPGEEKELKLILTKTMNENNVGLLNNRAEICDTYNEYGNVDIDSTPYNEIKEEDDLGSADVILAISTGGTTIWYIILAIINTGLIFIAIRLMIKNRIIDVKFRKERR